MGRCDRFAAGDFQIRQTPRGWLSKLGKPTVNAATRAFQGFGVAAGPFLAR